MEMTQEGVSGQAQSNELLAGYGTRCQSLLSFSSSIRAPLWNVQSVLKESGRSHKLQCLLFFPGNVQSNQYYTQFTKV